MKKSYIITAIAVLYLVMLYAMFIISASGLDTIYKGAGIVNDNVLHILAFFILAFLLRMMFTSRLFALRHPLLWSFFISLLVAGIIELLQLVVPSRHASLFDLALHLIGIIVYMAIDPLIKRHIAYFLKQKA